MYAGSFSGLKREGNRPDRRIVPFGQLPQAFLEALALRIQYAGSGHHKLFPGDYGFLPPVNPRPSKSVCDDLRPLLMQEALTLFRLGIQHGMVSRFGETDNPKYIWAVDDTGEAYEAKESKSAPNSYHGYRLGEDDYIQRLVLQEWKQRCRQR
jgi:hypothetical protein